MRDVRLVSNTRRKWRPRMRGSRVAVDGCRWSTVVRKLKPTPLQCSRLDNAVRSLHNCPRGREAARGRGGGEGRGGERVCGAYCRWIECREGTWVAGRLLNGQGHCWSLPVGHWPLPLVTGHWSRFEASNWMQGKKKKRIRIQ
jgi:hypothetical protein